MKTVKDLLQDKSSNIWSISPRATVLDALKFMSEKQIGALMVLDEKGEVHGIMSERDYARKVILLGKASKDTTVSEIMTPTDKMYYVKPEHTIEECMVIMTAKHIRHLPVCDAGKLCGLVSIGDAVKSIISEKDELIQQLSNYIAGKYL